LKAPRVPPRRRKGAAARDRVRRGVAERKRQDGLVDLLVRADLLLSEGFSERAKEHGVSPAECCVIEALGEHERVRMSVLAKLVLFSPTRLTKVIDRMERARLVERHLSKQDRRSILVSLTKDGRQLVAPVARVARQRETAVSRALDPAAARKLTLELTRLVDCLASLARAARRGAAPPSAGARATRRIGPAVPTDNGPAFSSVPGFDYRRAAQ
jgi:DNA-binding MarR family transcriptional regulator